MQIMILNIQIFISVVQHSLLNQKKEVIKVKIIVLKKNSKDPLNEEEHTRAGLVIQK